MESRATSPSAASARVLSLSQILPPMGQRESADEIGLSRPRTSVSLFDFMLMFTMGMAYVIGQRRFWRIKDTTGS